jgi:hypothetical protein
MFQISFGIIESALWMLLPFHFCLLAAFSKSLILLIFIGKITALNIVNIVLNGAGHG